MKQKRSADAEDCWALKPPGHLFSPHGGPPAIQSGQVVSRPARPRLALPQTDHDTLECLFRDASVLPKHIEAAHELLRVA